MLKRQVLRTIQSGKEKEWYAAVTDAALFMAAGGFLNEANELLEGLWKHNLEHDRTTWLADRAFEMLWYAAGKRPKAPFAKMNIDELEAAHREYLAPSLVQFAKFDEINHFMQAITLAKLNDGKFPDGEVEKKALNHLEIYLETSNGSYSTCQALSLATELATRSGKQKIATDILKKWAVEFDKYPYKNAVVLIGCNRHVAPLLLKGIIAEELNLTKDLCEDFVAKAIETIDNRIRNGPSLVYGNLSWKELLKKLSELSIKKEPGEYTDEQKEKMWIGKKPVHKRGIIAAETKLGLKLPEDYKEFLRVSNGFSNFPLVNPELIKIEKLDYLKNVYFNIYGDTNMFEIIARYPGENGAGTISKFIEDAIAISILPEEQEVWLIQPKLDHKEWQCWFFAYWHPGEYRYRSFRHYIESQIQILDDE